MKALFWKDVRINRFPLLMGVILLVLPYAIIVGLPANMGLSSWPQILMQGGAIGIGGAYITLALLGEIIIATERADRSAEFLAYLPPSKRQILISKATLLFGTGAILIGLNLTAALLGVSLANDREWTRQSGPQMLDLARIATFSIAAAGASWCAFSMAASTGGPVGLGLLTPIAIAAALGLSNYFFGWPSDASIGDTIFAACGLMGIALFILGCVYYLRRVEP